MGVSDLAEAGRERWGLTFVSALVSNAVSPHEYGWLGLGLLAITVAQCALDDLTCGKDNDEDPGGIRGYALLLSAVLAVGIFARDLKHCYEDLHR